MKAERNQGPMTYRLHVVAPSAAEVAANVAGLIVDRVMGGWRVTVALADTGDTRPLEILGAQLIDADDVAAEPEEDRCVLAIDAELYTRAARGDVRHLLSRGVDVLVWGSPLDPDHAVQHHLSAAGRAFKSEALAAAGVLLSQVGWTEDFTSAEPEARIATLRA